MEYWKSLFGRDGFHYNIYSLTRPEEGMAELREMFPEGEADSLNFVLFSTSGVHGDYGILEELELPSTITFLIVHPRTVTLKYGNALVRTKEDVEYLKKLRASSHAAVLKIGVKDDAA